MSWSRNLDYEQVFEKFHKALVSNAAEWKWYKRPDRRIKVSILMIALRNGMRSSEAIDAYSEFIRTEERVVRVRVRKRGFKYVKDEAGRPRRISQGPLPDEPVFRNGHIPEEITAVVPKGKITNKGMYKFCDRRFGFPVHALRYCFITAMSKRGVSAQLIAKMTQHAKLDMILGYTEQMTADKLLADGVL